jgi:predicted  nucleic acid-binding Zn-ribbon protein
VASQEFVKGLYEDAEQSMHGVLYLMGCLLIVTIKLVLERSEIPLQRRDKRPLRAVGAEEEHNHLRAELETTKDELRKTKRALRDAQRQVEQWRTAAMKLSTAVERASEQISIATEGQDVIEISDSE